MAGTFAAAGGTLVSVAGTSTAARTSYAGAEKFLALEAGISTTARLPQLER